MEALYGSNLQNFKNYGVYVPLVKNGNIQIFTKDINKDNIDSHFYSILNILRDGIETDYVQHMAINIMFADNVDVTLSIFDYMLNLMMWTMPAKTDEQITSYYLFFDDVFNKYRIKEYIDTKFLNKNRSRISNKKLCNIIDDTLYKLRYIDEFSLYLCNTINDEDTIELMNVNQEFYDCVHADLSKTPIEDVKNAGMAITNKAINIMKNSEHCLGNSFAVGEGINPKQFREFAINIGTVPDGDGGAYPHIINSSFINKGLSTLSDILPESGKGRQALIISKKNVGTSGAFARILGLNNRDTNLHSNPNYSCGTKNFIKITIYNEKVLKMYNNRYYRFRADGPEMKINYRTDKHLIGQTVLFRSPCTCASHARGEGICYRCYGDLAYTNYDINIGTIAAEILSSELTQMLLSAKHLLESNIKNLDWCDEFSDIFDVSYNAIHIKDDFDCKKWTLEIDTACMDFDEEEEETVRWFNVISPKGKVTQIYLKSNDELMLSQELSDLVKSMPEPTEGNYMIDMEKLIDTDLFLVHIANNELSDTLNKVKEVISKLPKVNGMTKDIIIQEFVNAVINGNLSVSAVHLEVIIANQIRLGLDDDKVLENPDWTDENAEYALVNLDTALKKHPSITVSLEYQKISKTLYNPLSYTKTAPSQTDLYFMPRPQEFMNMESRKVKLSPEEDEMIKGMMYIDEEEEILLAPPKDK